MSDSLYRGTVMVLGDADANFCRKVSTAFFSGGLRDLAVCADAEQLRKALASPTDVILCDVDLPGAKFHDIAQNIRQGRLGANPFVVMIALTRMTETTNIPAILESGVDDLIVKPCEAEIVVQRVGALAIRRNSFVVTPAYVGPSRRHMKRADGSDEEVVEVPNTLRAKVAQRMVSADLTGMLETGRATLADNRSQSGIRVISRLTRQLANQQFDENTPYGKKHAFRTLAQKADELVEEHRDSKATFHVAAIAERIALLARRGETGTTKAMTIETGLLLQLADATLVAYLASQKSAATTSAPAILSIVDEYLKQP